MEVFHQREERGNQIDFESEKELVKRARKDPNAFSELYELNYKKIFNYILRRTTNIEIAQDITSETFVKALENIGGFKWKNIRFSSWLYRIASNEIANYFRKNKYKAVSFEKIAPLPSSSNLMEEIIEAEENIQKQKDFLEISRSISKLPPIYQEVISFRFFEKKKISEISEILGKHEGTVKSLLHRGLEKLKDLS